MRSEDFNGHSRFEAAKSENNRGNQLLNGPSYESTYKRIKMLHGKQIVKDWTERTDPQKFVFEDCGIASYLLELWRTFNIPVKRFADLGCGNGLLVHLLTKEGFSGVGLDVRERKIWEQFREQGTQLREAALDPSSLDSVQLHLEGVDFLIGNHSDELTPWIPVIAARIGCNFLLLPCCRYDFFSRFMKRSLTAHEKESGRPNGAFVQYYAYIGDICTRLGFTVKTDYMKIPSPKRKCFIGEIPDHGLPDRLCLDSIIGSLLSTARSPKAQKVFEPRPSKEIVCLPPTLFHIVFLCKLTQVKNCTQIPVEYRASLGRRIIEFILDAGTEEDGINCWRFGSPVPLSVLATQLLNSTDRQMLARQNGGIQTFLRNFHQLFQVSEGSVSIRNWPLANEKFAQKAGPNVRRSDCWFRKLHPDGCPLSSEVCSYKH